MAQKIKHNLIPLLQNQQFAAGAKSTEEWCDRLYATIPDSKRISYGIVFVICSLGEFVYAEISKKDVPLLTVCAALCAGEGNFKAKAPGLYLSSCYVMWNYEAVLPIFERAAADESWQVREMARMFFLRRNVWTHYPVLKRPA